MDNFRETLKQKKNISRYSGNLLTPPLDNGRPYFPSGATRPRSVHFGILVEVCFKPLHAITVTQKRVDQHCDIQTHAKTNTPT